MCFELDQEFFSCTCLRECSTATCADRIHGTSWFHEVTKVELSQFSLIDGRMSIPGGSEMSKLLLRTGWVTLAYPRDNHLTCLFTDASDLHWGLESTQKISRNLSKNSDIDHFYEWAFCWISALSTRAWLKKRLIQWFMLKTGSDNSLTLSSSGEYKLITEIWYTYWTQMRGRT